MGVRGYIKFLYNNFNITMPTTINTTDFPLLGNQIGDYTVIPAPDGTEKVLVEQSSGAYAFVLLSGLLSTGGATNLSATASPTGVLVASDTGTDATVPLADATNAGLLSPADFAKLVTNATNNPAGTAAPTATDDSSAGYSVGSLWVDTVADKAYVLVDDTAGAAVWVDITAAGGGATPSASETVAGIIELATVLEATTGTDGTRAITPATLKAVLDAGVGAVTSGATNPGTGTAGDIFYNTTDNLFYGHNGTAFEPLKTGLDNKSGTAAPTATDDSGDGYSVGSVWIDETNDEAYILVDATAGAAVWEKITTDGEGGGATSSLSLATTFSYGYGPQWDFGSNQAISAWQTTGNWQQSFTSNQYISHATTSATYVLESALPVFVENGNTLQFNTSKTLSFEIYIETGAAAGTNFVNGMTGLADTNGLEGFYFIKDFSTAQWIARSRDAAGFTEDTNVTIAPNTAYLLRAELTPGVDAKFYIDDVLVATHTTTLPAGTATVFYRSESRADGTNRVIDLFAAPVLKSV